VHLHSLGVSSRQHGRRLLIQLHFRQFIHDFIHRLETGFSHRGTTGFLYNTSSDAQASIWRRRMWKADGLAGVGRMMTDSLFRFRSE
jgi:hypothetical protein